MSMRPTHLLLTLVSVGYLAACSSPTETGAHELGAGGTGGTRETGSEAGRDGSPDAPSADAGDPGIDASEDGEGDEIEAPAPSDAATGDVADADAPAALVDAGEGGPSPLVIILKLDDLRAETDNLARFQKVADIVGKKKIRASFGIIADGYTDDGTKQGVYDWTKQIAARGDIEFWHHGLDHSRATDKSSSEFRNRDLASQKSHLKTAEDLLKDKCGVTMHSFGAPYNESDATTVEAMKAVPDIKVWMYPDVKTAPQLLLTAKINMEPSTGVLDVQYFKTNYSQRPVSPYLVIQGHPPYWDDAEMSMFEENVDFLIAQGVTFLTPYDYYMRMKSKP